MRILAVLAVVSVLSGVIALGHWAIYRAGIYFWNITSPRLRRYGKIKMTVLGASFIVMTFATSFAYTTVGAWAYLASAVWLGTALWLFLASALSIVIAVILKKAGVPRIGRYVGQLLMIAALGVSAYGLIHSYDTQVTRYTARLPGLPAAWQGKTIALISDTHLGSVRGIDFSRKIAGMVAAEKPEMLLIAGDFYDGPPADYATLAEPFGALDLPHGVLFANGNHEEFNDKQTYDVALENAGVTVLSDVLLLVDGLQIAGVDYASSNDNESASSTLAAMGIAGNMPTILIKHAPNALDAIEDAGVDLMVSGHTHGGQTWPMTLLIRAVHGAFTYGQNPHGSLQVITTSGAGTWGPPQRVGTDPEIVLITLERAE